MKSKQKQHIEYTLPSKGYHNFEVMRAEEIRSQDGGSELELYLKVSTPNTTWVIDRISSDDFEKIEKFMQSTGMEEKFRNGELTPEQCVGKQGQVKLKIENSPQFGIRVMVNGYYHLDELPRSASNI